MLAYVHNVPILGPPGAGTSMLARRLTTMFPAMTLAEAIETTRIHSVAGLIVDRTALVTTHPCRAPHHTISDVGMIGGGHVPLVEGCREDSSQALCGSNSCSPAPCAPARWELTAIPCTLAYGCGILGGMALQVIFLD
jgi:hypothetical protein